MDTREKIAAVNFRADWITQNPGKTAQAEMMRMRQRGENWKSFWDAIQTGQKFLEDEIFAYNPTGGNGEYDFTADGVHYHYSESSGVERIQEVI